MHGSDGNRKAFTFGTILGRKDTVRITCLAVDSDSQRLFLGLSNGQVEEYQLQHSPSSPVPTCRLLSERRISRTAEVSELCCLPVALCLVVRTDDGAVQLAAYETSALHQLPSTKGSYATVIAGDAMRAPARLAVVLRAVSVLNKAAKATQIGPGGPTHSSKILVYAVASGPGGMSHSAQPAHLLARVSIPEPVLDLAWVKDGILAAVPGGYLLIQSGCKVIEVAPGVTTRAMLAACPPMRQALMLFGDTMLLLVDSQGAAIREPVLLSERPVAAALTPAFVVAVTEEAIFVYDSNTSQLVQQVAFAHDDAWVAASGRLPCVQDFKSGTLLLATSCAIMCLQPVELEQQVWELLKQHRYRQAILLAHSALASDQPWAGPALAQAGLLLLRAMRVQEAMEAFTACPVDTWQPAHLLSLFPSVTARWLPDMPPAKAYWGLHGPGPLQSLTHICNHYLDAHKAEQARQAALDTDALMRNAKAQIAAYIIKVRERPGLVCLEALDTLAVVLLCESGQTTLLEAFLSSGPAAAATAAVNAACGSASEASTTAACTDGASSAQLPLLQHLSSSAVDRSAAGLAWKYEDMDFASTSTWGGGELQQAPVVSGTKLLVSSADALDSAARLACSAALRESVRALELGRRWHALALLRAARNHVEEALSVWQGLCEGQLQEALSAAGVGTNSSTACVAVAAAAALLLQPQSAPTQLLLQQLPWLLMHGPIQALMLLKYRMDVTVEAALSLLQGHTGDVRWMYLRHLIYDRSMTDSSLHTELALELLECIQREAQSSAEGGITVAEGQSAVSSSGSDARTGSRLQEGRTNGFSALGTSARGGPAPRRLQESVDVGQGPAGSSGSGNTWAPLDMNACLAAVDDYCRRQRQVQQRHQQPHHQQSFSTSQLTQQQQGSIGQQALISAPLHRSQSTSGVARLGSSDVALLLQAAVEQPSSSGSYNAGLQAQVPQLLRLRAALLLHLHQSASYDPAVVLTAIGPLPPLPTDRQSSTSSSAADDESSSSETSRALGTDILLPVEQGPGSWRPDSCPPTPALEQADSGKLLLRERVLLLSRLGDHGAALALLAFRMGDLEACIVYCRQQAAAAAAAAAQEQPGSEDPAPGTSDQLGLPRSSSGVPNTSWLVLLELLLNPGPGRQPMYAAAVRVLHEEGGSLSPLQVLAALPDGMPLHVAAQQLTNMLAGVMHRRRHTQVVKGLHRARNLTVRGELALLSRQRTVITEDSACHGCHRLLLDKVVYGYPSGMLMCARCAKPSPNGDPWHC